MSEFKENYRNIAQMNKSICSSGFYNYYEFKDLLDSNILFLNTLNHTETYSMASLLEKVRDTIHKYELAILSGKTSNWWHSENKHEEEVCLVDQFHLNLQDLLPQYFALNHQILNIIESKIR
jgi:hypothetical protein